MPVVPKTPQTYIPYIGAVCGDSPQRNRQLPTKTRRVWFTRTTPTTINVGTNNASYNSKLWTSTPRLTKPLEVVMLIRIREVSRTDNHPLIIQTTTIDTVLSTGLDQAVRPLTFRRNWIGRISDRPGAETSYASDGAGGSGSEKGECRASIHHEEPTTTWTNSVQTAFPIQVSLPPRRTQRPQTPPRRRRHHSSSDDSESSSGRDRNGRRRAQRLRKIKER
ncbi:hypothetical protein PIB30_069953, partial [Stylosanthes scabra]|nr:hypothetical protein [Stylosanthes scabra]